MNTADRARQPSRLTASNRNSQQICWMHRAYLRAITTTCSLPIFAKSDD
jgi:hypothetical protein